MKTKNSFSVKHIFFATIPPYDSDKKYKNKLLKYRVITTPGETSDYLFDIFDKASDDCKIEILFKSDQNQNNTIRSLLLGIISTTDIKQKEKLFQALSGKMYEITDSRNGMGLLVLIEGFKENQTRLMLCRFKGAQGLHNEGDDLKYISQVFTKQNKHYKIAVFQDEVSSKSFWKGYAIDRQTAANNYKPFSLFWIESFLQAETAITNAQGTSQFSKIVKNILNNSTSITDKEEIISAIVNLKTKKNQRISVKSFGDKYLSDELKDKLEAHTNNDEFYNSIFQIDEEVFKKELGNTVLLLEDGITAFVPTFQYDKHVTEQRVGQEKKKIKIEGVLKSKKINVRNEKSNGEKK